MKLYVLEHIFRSYGSINTKYVFAETSWGARKIASMVRKNGARRPSFNPQSVWALPSFTTCRPVKLPKKARVLVETE